VCARLPGLVGPSAAGTHEPHPMPSSDKPARAVFGALVSNTARQWRRAINRQLLPLGLTEATWLPLWHVARSSHPMRQKDLAALLALDTSSVVRLLDELQGQGLIERREGEDRRAKILHVTPAGQAIVTQVGRQTDQVRATLLAGIDDAALNTAVQVLEQVLSTLAALNGAEPGEAAEEA